MATFKQTYSTSQTNQTIITPASGKKIYIWQAMIESDGTSSLDFLTSETKPLELSGAGAIGASSICAEGQADEVLSLNCDTNTTVSILYDELS